jgi:hypothetical protein
MASISHRDVVLLKMRELACFCSECVDDNSELCENKKHVELWRLHTLEPLNVTHVIFQWLFMYKKGVHAPSSTSCPF